MKKLIFCLLLFIPSLTFAQNSVNAKGIFSGNTQDTTSIKNTLSSLQALYGPSNYGGLYFNNVSNKWRIWVGKCSTCPNDSTWIDLFGSTATGISSVDNGLNLSPSSTNARLGGALVVSTTIQGNFPFTLGSNNLSLIDSVSGVGLNYARVLTPNGHGPTGKQSVLFFGYHVGNASYHPAFGSTTSFGSRSMTNITTGDFNDAFGNLSLELVTTGERNSAFGHASLSRLTTGTQNVGIGVNALEVLTTSSYNTMVGHESGINITGERNTGMGESVLNGNTTGNQNVAMGQNAMFGSVSASNSVSIGFQSGRGISGNNNIFLGSSSGFGEGATLDGKLFISSYDSATQHLIPLVRGDLRKGTLGIWVSGHNPTSHLELAYGNIAPGRSSIKIPAGKLLTSTESGAIENNGIHLYWTDSVSNTRFQLDQQGGGGSPGGSNTNIQYNGSGSFAGDSRFVYFSATNQQQLNSANGNTIALNAAASSAGGEVIGIGDSNNTLSLSPAGITLIGSGAPTFAITSETSTGNTGKITYVTDVSHTFDSRLSNTVLIIKRIPTSSAGLASGSIYSNAGVLTIVP